MIRQSQTTWRGVLRVKNSKLLCIMNIIMINKYSDRNTRRQ